MSIFSFLSGPLDTVLERVIPDTNKRKEMTHEITTMFEKNSQAIRLAQIEVNKEEAKHKSIFVSGWRPFIGWVCGLAMAMNWLITPLINMLLLTFGVTDAQGNSVQIPLLDLAEMMPVIMGLLGLGTLRTVEKIKDRARN